MTGSDDTRHVPVMFDRVCELLAPALAEPGAVLVDATVGMGGHATGLLAACPDARLLGLDRDPAALAEAQRRLSAFEARVRLVHGENDAIPQVLSELGIDRIRGALFDLGVSSLQLDEDDRGFAYSRDVPLDMRMNPTAGPTAAELLATASVQELTRILRDYGEERFARRIAERIVRVRETRPLRTTGQLAELVEAALPAAARHGGGHPAKRTFQAVRIEVNGELSVLARALPAALDALDVGGRVAVLAYHSLEDRIVKRELTDRSTPQVPPGVPVVPEAYQPTFRLLTRGAERPDTAEVAANPRARSARLRAAERIRAGRPSGAGPRTRRRGPHRREEAA